MPRLFKPYYLTLLVTILHTQLHVLTQGMAFLLHKGFHYHEHNLALGIHGVYVFFLEIDQYVLVLKLTDIFQTIQCASTKTADGLCDVHIYITVHTLVYHAVKLPPMQGTPKRPSHRRRTILCGLLQSALS